MWRAVSSILLLLCLASLQAEPFVAGFARFHQEPFSDEESGHLLISELNCAQCHTHPSRTSKGAPILDGVGARLQPDWLRAYLTDPQKAHPGATMPDVLADKTQVDALVHFLVSQKDGWKAPRLGKYSAPHTGKKLFARIGCITCHDYPPLENLAAKYSYHALTEFLQHPLKHRPGGRMPDLHLELQEAADIAAYLLDTLDEADNTQRGRLKSFAIDEGKAQIGQTIFTQVGCANCHALGNQQPSSLAPPWPTSATCSKAHYALSPSQSKAIHAAVSKPFPELTIKHTLAALNCYACHQRDKLGGPEGDMLAHFTGNEALGNEGKFPPTLTGVGRKLHPTWLKSVLNGDGKMRPYMPTRMPSFGPNNVEPLIQQFADADQSDDSSLSGGDLEAGRILLGTQGGVGCITCHDLDGRKGLAMNAITLTGATARYRPAWFRENLIHPTRLRPGTLMPSFWPNGVAGNQTILSGDTDNQIAAIWSYLKEGKEPPPGYPDFDKGAFEITPTDRPVVQRTFMDDVGTHAIAVGFPEGVHFAFDADRCQLSLIWKGRFIDGYKTWFSRVDPSAKPLGSEVRRFPADDQERHFLGYTLDKDGVPTFRYREGDQQITDRIEPDENGGFRRTTTGKGTTNTSFAP